MSKNEKQNRVSAKAAEPVIADEPAVVAVESHVGLLAMLEQAGGAQCHAIFVRLAEIRPFLDGAITAAEPNRPLTRALMALDDVL